MDGLLASHPSAIARLISWAENRDRRMDDVLRRVYPRGGSARRVGITGPPGAGKSTAVASMIAAIRARGERVGVIAVDPTSPFTGGALLGDRYRMLEATDDSGVFMRSMASRGSLGGLAAATEEAVDLLDAAGFEWILVETVGVGQTEFDVVEATDTVVVILVPESGDGIQALKAGLMEIADVFAVNKADRPGADAVINALNSGLDLRSGRNAPRPGVLPLVATRGEGIPELLAAILAHQDADRGSGRAVERRRGAVRRRLLREARVAVVDRLASAHAESLESWVDKVANRFATPRDAAQAILKEWQS